MQSSNGIKKADFQQWSFYKSKTQNKTACEVLLVGNTEATMCSEILHEMLFAGINSDYDFCEQ